MDSFFGLNRAHHRAYYVRRRRGYLSGARSRSTRLRAQGTPETQLFEAVRHVHGGRRFVPPEVASVLASRLPDSDLTARERDVLTLIVKGMSNKAIGNALGISEGTVKTHVNVILAKLGVEDRTQAAVAALHRGLVHL